MEIHWSQYVARPGLVSRCLSKVARSEAKYSFFRVLLSHNLSDMCQVVKVVADRTPCLPYTRF